MEFFERAHVSKKQPLKKDSKSEEMVKKHLKQMLKGYKISDNELIKNSGNASNDIVAAHEYLDESVSVPSDLDSNSSSAADITEPTTSKSSNKDLLSGVSSSVEILSEDTNSPESMNDILNEVNLDDSNDNEEEYIEKEDATDVSLSSTDFSEDSDISKEVSLINLDDSTELSSDDCDVFDADGALASKILENLRKNENVTVKKCSKRKLEEIPPKKNKSKKNNICNKNNNNSNIIDTQDLNNDNEETIENISDESALDSASSNASSQFVSITISEMPEQKLSDVLGDYQHPTVRNLPSVHNSDEITGLLSADIENIVEDVDSLVPELGDEEIIDDLIEDLETSADIPTEESTSLYDDTIQSESDRELSTEEEFVNPVKVYYGKKSCIFVLKHPIQLYVNGKVKIKALAGTVEVFGHILKDEVELYAPNNSFAQCLRTVKNENEYYGLFNKLTSEGLLVQEAEDIVTSIGEYDGVLCMSALIDPKIDFVENNVNTDLFTKPNKNIESSLRQASMKLGCSLYLTRPWRYFEENEVWQEAFNCGLEKNSRGIICGGKGLGKSTFLRHYVNRMLGNGPVLVIDFDPGQAEFTVAGNVSATVVTTPLLGPNYTHLKTPDIMLNVGLINTMDNITRYANAIADLLARCRSNPAYSTMPWVINTMGMCTQMGLKFLLLIILHAKPSFLLQIDTKVAKKRFECHLQANIVQDMFEKFKDEKFFRNVDIPYLDYSFILAQHAEGSDRHYTAMSPKDERYLNFLAYFGELMNIHRGVPFLGIVPYEVSLADLNVLTNVKVASDAVLQVINGKIVALCQLAIADKGKVFTLEDNAPLCLGHGLIRGVDLEKALVYVVTPLAPARLAGADAVLYADWAPELRGPERALAAGAALPYRCATHHKHKQLMLSPRRRFNPLQLLKMSRSA